MHWLSKWLRKSSSAHATPRRRPTWRLGLEQLEDRTLLSVSLSLSGPQTLFPSGNVNVSNNVANQIASWASEMAIAINPTNPLNVVGFTHDVNQYLVEGHIQVFSSTDGGAYGNYARR